MKKHNPCFHRTSCDGGDNDEGEGDEMDCRNKDDGLDNINAGYGESKVDLGDMYNGGGNSSDDNGVGDVGRANTIGGDDADFGNGDTNFILLMIEAAVMVMMKMRVVIMMMVLLTLVLVMTLTVVMAGAKLIAVKIQLLMTVMVNLMVAVMLMKMARVVMIMMMKVMMVLMDIKMKVMMMMMVA